MFDDHSRYKDVPDILAPHYTGRAFRAKDVRALPPAPAVLVHDVRAGDRLDGLAAAYYEDSTSWWRFCDAHPEILWPPELIRDGARRTATVAILASGRDEERPALVRKMQRARREVAGLAGVDCVRLKFERTLFADLESHRGRTYRVHRQLWRYQFVVDFNAPSLQELREILECLERHELQPMEPQLSCSAGRRIGVSAP